MDTVNLKLLTPLWTGDIYQKSAVSRETGLIGSMRWWYEAIVRSLGYRACDPTCDSGSDKRCTFDFQKYDAARDKKGLSQSEVLASAGLCPACQSYGATGYARRFRLEISGGKTNPCFESDSAIAFKPHGGDRGWRLGSGVVGDLTLNVVPLRAAFDPIAVYMPLLLASKWGGLGARTQVGFGVTAISRVEAAVSQLVLEKSGSWHDRLRSAAMLKDNGLPDLRQFFFAKVRFVGTTDWWKQVKGIRNALENDRSVIEWVNGSSETLPRERRGSVPIAPAIKDWMRFGNGGFSAIAGVPKEAEEFIYGKAGGDNDRRQSCIHISSAYPAGTPARRSSPYEFRVWGWVPDGADCGFKRDEFLSDLNGQLQGEAFAGADRALGPGVTDVKTEWREFHSPRDPERQEENALEFLKSLIA